MKRAVALLALAGLPLASGLSQAAEPLGRFFFTPAQRAQLDVARSQKSRATLASEQTEDAAQALPDILTYGGSVRRSDGKSTVWLNNRAVHDQQSVEGLAVIGRVNSSGAVEVQVPQTNRNIELKPGQSVDIGSGIIEEPYARSMIAPKPAPKSSPESSQLVSKPVPVKPPPTPGLKPAEKAALEAKVQAALDQLRRERLDREASEPSGR